LIRSSDFWAQRLNFGVEVRYQLGARRGGPWRRAASSSCCGWSWRTRPDAGSAQAAGLAGALWLVFRLVGSVVAGPVAEELAFRGYLTRRLIAADFRAMPPGTFSWPAFLASSALFGLTHGVNWPAATLAGMAYALVYYRRGKLSDAVLAHATTNLLLAAYALATGDWSRWS
jgi:CAAX prenyl protease-like protein